LGRRERRDFVGDRRQLSGCRRSKEKPQGNYLADFRFVFAYNRMLVPVRLFAHFGTERAITEKGEVLAFTPRGWAEKVCATLSKR
jgi:hypothetical protein